MNNTCRFLLILLFVTAAISCKKHSSDHLPPKTMEQVLLDINMAEALSSLGRTTNHFGGAKNPDSLASFYNDVFTHYKITQKEFTESMAWYKNHPDELDTVYAEVATHADKLLTAQSIKVKK